MTNSPHSPPPMSADDILREWLSEIEKRGMSVNVSSLWMKKLVRNVWTAARAEGHEKGRKEHGCLECYGEGLADGRNLSENAGWNKALDSYIKTLYSDTDGYDGMTLKSHANLADSLKRPTPESRDAATKEGK